MTNVNTTCTLAFTEVTEYDLRDKGVSIWREDTVWRGAGDGNHVVSVSLCSSSS